MNDVPSVPLITTDALERSFRTTDIEPLASLCRAQGRRAVGIDGFSGVGKSTLATALSEALDVALISLDDFLPDSPESMTVQSYVDRLDRDRLRRAIERARCPIVEGVLLRDALAGIIARKELTALYYMACSSPTGGALIWNDGFEISDEATSAAPNWLDRSIIEYHRRERPYADADALVIRVSSD